MENENNNPNENSAGVGEDPKPRAQARIRSWAGHGWLLLPLVLLVVSRLLFVHDNPTDFPMDRNLSSAERIEGVVRRMQQSDTLVASVKHLLRAPAETPEFPFMPDAAWVMAKTGIEPLVAGRLFSLFSAFLTAIGIYLIGLRWHSKLLGLTAATLYALAPFSIFMGRVLLPDPFMMAAVVWMIVAAGAGLGHTSYRSAVWMAIWLFIAALAKLPAIFFAPVGALVLVEKLGWRRPGAWIAVAIVAVLSYLVVCFWYPIPPLNPFEGLREMSRQTNSMLVSGGQLLQPGTLKITISRLVLAMTLPGTILMLAGWVVLQGQRRGRLWLNLWMVFALIYVALTLRANTYWAYAIVPVGVLLAALAIVQCIRLSWWTMVPLIVLLMLSLAACPGVEQVRDYLAIDSRYRGLEAMADRHLRTGGNLLYDGRVPRDMQYYIGRAGQYVPPGAGLDEKLSLMGKRNFRFYLSNLMTGMSLDGILFDRKPVLETRPLRYVLYETEDQMGLGKPVERAGEEATTPTFPLVLDLGGRIAVRDVQVPKARFKPGERLDLTVVYEKGDAGAENINLVLEIVHEYTQEAFPLAPWAGGASFIGWSMPQVQVPDFVESAIESMRYEYELPRHLPAGDYGVRFSLLADPARQARVGQSKTVDGVFEFFMPALVGELPQTVDLNEAIWLNPAPLNVATWLGGQRVDFLLRSNGMVWMRPQIAPGEYELVITGRGIPAGEHPIERWPRIKLRQPSRASDVDYRFSSSGFETLVHRFQWYGPNDFIQLSILNPMIDWTTRIDPFPLYLYQLSSRNRSVQIQSIEVREPSGS